MTPLRFGLVGCGFWSRFQLAAWRELPGVECVAVCDVDEQKAAALAAHFGIPRFFTDAAALIEEVRPDFIDILAGVEAHRSLVECAARSGVPVICQKPMASSLADAEAMVATCDMAGVPFLIHENWRWQAPLRSLGSVLGSGVIGRPFRARIEFCCSFPVFENQPALAALDRFIILDIGSHLLDVGRFYFGEADVVFATTNRINPAIRGEDVATVVTRHGGCTVVTNMSYASRTERERFPETFVFVEGSEGSVEVAPGCELHVTTKEGTVVRRMEPESYDWIDPAYLVVQSSIVDCQRHLLAALRGETVAETTGADNLETLRLVFAAYDSAASGKSIDLSSMRAVETVARVTPPAPA